MDKKEVLLEENGSRLDVFLSKYINHSRNQIEQLIKNGFVYVNNKQILKNGHKLKTGDDVSYELKDMLQVNKTDDLQNIDFDVNIIYEDDDILVINKPSNLTVHDAPSVNEPTLVDWLKSKNYSLSTISGELRHGIVHRLDKGTSGVMVVAKNNHAHTKLSEQLNDKSMGRYYLALIDLPLKEDMIVEKPIGRNPNNRLKMGIVQDGRYAKSAFCKLLNSHDNKYELISAKLFTGRTHQIRVHLNSINRHILGDILYGFKGNLDIFSRVYLHAYILYLRHPTKNEYMTFTAHLPQDMQSFLDKNFNTKDINEKISQDNIISCFNISDQWMYCK